MYIYIHTYIHTHIQSSQRNGIGMNAYTSTYTHMPVFSPARICMKCFYSMRSVDEHASIVQQHGLQIQVYHHKRLFSDVSS